MKDKMPRRTLAYWLFTVGVFSALVPWTSLWSRNAFIALAGPFESRLVSTWVRGAFCGAGVLLALVGARDALARD
jgi:hypothetical protein